MDRRVSRISRTACFKTHLIECIISQLKELILINKNTLIVGNRNRINRPCRKCTIRKKDRIFSPFQSIRTGCGAYQGLYQRVRGPFKPEVNGSVSEAAHSPSISYWIYGWAEKQLHSLYDFMTYTGKFVSFSLVGSSIKSRDEVGSVV